MEEGPYATVNHETASNVSRPSRVKRYHDSDSEISSFAGSAGHFYSKPLPHPTLTHTHTPTHTHTHTRTHAHTLRLWSLPDANGCWSGGLW